jgi:hypothetical protein
MRKLGDFLHLGIKMLAAKKIAMGLQGTTGGMP